jgi:hypothetical protein
MMHWATQTLSRIRHRASDSATAARPKNAGLLAGLCALAALALAPPDGLAQSGRAKEPPPPSKTLRLERFDFSALPDLRLYLSYIEGDGTVISGRVATDFVLNLDSQEQGAAKALTTFDQLKEPIFVMAIAQVSTVVQEKQLGEMKQGFYRLNDVVAATPGGRMGVLAYAGETKRLVESGTQSEVQAALGKLAIDTEASEAHMLDAVRTGIDLLKAQEKGRRKLIVLVSDGIDVNNEVKRFKELGILAWQAGIVIDTIGYNEFDPPKLLNLTEMTRKSYGVNRVAKTVNEIGPHFDEIIDEIKQQYVLTFPLTIVGDDKDKTFQVYHSAGSHQTPSNAVNEKLPSHPVGPAKVVTQEQPRKTWWWLLIPAGLLAAIIAALLLRKKPAPPPEQPKLQAPSLSPQVRPGSKTVALDAAGEVAMGWIMGLTGKYKDVTFKLKDRTVIGTAADCDVVIEDGFMSGRHCEIRKVEGGYKLVDLGATNGVIVNDKRAKEHFLVDNDNFRLGRTEFKFKSIFS